MKNPLGEILAKKKMSLKELKQLTGLSQDRIKELRDATISIALIEEKDYKKILKALNMGPFKLFTSMLEPKDLKPKARKNPGKLLKILKVFDKHVFVIGTEKRKPRKKPNQTKK